MREVGLAVIATLVLVVVGAHVFGGPIPMLWAHSLAHECDGDTAPRRCVPAVPGTVAGTRGDEVTVTLPAQGPVRAVLPGASFTERDAVSVAVLGEQVLWVAGADGTRAEAEPRPGVSVALARFALVSAGAIVLVGAVGLWRRGGWWVRPMAGSVTAGTLLGLSAGSVAGHHLAMPVLFGVTALGSLGTAYVWVVHVQQALSRRPARH